MMDFVYILIIGIVTGLVTWLFNFLMRRFRVIRFIFKNVRFFKSTIKTVIIDILKNMHLINEDMVQPILQLLDIGLDYVIDYGDDDVLEKSEIKEFLNELILTLNIKLNDQEQIVDIMASALERLYTFTK